jgi:hypothetical protein
MSAIALNERIQQPVWAVLGERAVWDNAFRQRLVSQPKDVLGEYLGAPIPANVQVHSHENTPSVVNVIVDPSRLAEFEALPDKGGKFGQAVKRAIQDPTYRHQLESNPHDTVKELTGIDMPAGMRLAVYQNTPTSIHLVVPPQYDPSGELSDAQLEMVAGGRTSPVPPIIGPFPIGPAPIIHPIHPINPGHGPAVLPGGPHLP